MKEIFNKFSPGVYVLLILCFLLPFINISCSRQADVSVTGIEMVTGSSFEQSSAYSQRTRTQNIDPQLWAIIAFAGAIGGLIISFTKIKNKPKINTVLSVIGIISLILLNFKISGDVSAQGKGMLKLDFLAGYWIALVLFLIGGILNSYLIVNLKISKSSLQ